MYRRPGETADLECSHSVDNYNNILWYKQSDGRFQLLGNMAASHGEAESGVKVKLGGGAGKGQTCSLTVEELGLNSSGFYLCAASYTAARLARSSA